MAKLVFCLALIFLCATTAFANWPCKYNIGGILYDFSHYGTIAGDNGGGMTTYLNFCENVKDRCTDGESSICIPKSPTQPTAVDNSFGSATLAPQPQVSKTDKGIQIFFNNGPEQCWSQKEFHTRKTYLNLICSNQDDQSFVVEETSECLFAITMNLTAACGESGGLSGGAIFLIVVFSALAVYFAIGFLVCKFYFKQPTIVRSIPHSSFWCSLPGFYIAGINFVISKITKSKNNTVSTASYGSVEDP